MYTERFTEVHVPLSTEYADSYGVGTVNSTYVSLTNYHRAFLLLNVGTMQATATLAASIRQATSTAGAGAKVISGKSITQLTQAGGDGDDLVGMELRAEELDVTGGFDSISVRTVVAAAAVEYAYTLFGVCPRYVPVPVTAWTEIVT